MLDELSKEILPYVTALAIENDKSMHFIGSGTFIQWGSNFGILTAEHVVNNPNEASRSLKNNKLLHVVIDGHKNKFAFECDHVEILTFGVRREDEYGPDLAVIKLPLCDKLGLISSKKSFCNLTNDIERNLQEAMNVNGFMAIVGHPDEDVTEVEHDASFKELFRSDGLIGFTVQENYFEREGYEGYDYLEIYSKRDDTNRAPFSYHGVSGGSLWRVVASPREGEVSTDRHNKSLFSKVNIRLAGVPFYQHPPDAPGNMLIRGHGPRSVYSELLKHLLVLRPKSRTEQTHREGKSRTRWKHLVRGLVC